LGRDPWSNYLIYLHNYLSSHMSHFFSPKKIFFKVFCENGVYIVQIKYNKTTQSLNRMLILFLMC